MKFSKEEAIKIATMAVSAYIEKVQKKVDFYDDCLENNQRGVSLIYLAKSLHMQAGELADNLIKDKICRSVGKKRRELRNDNKSFMKKYFYQDGSCRWRFSPEGASCIIAKYSGNAMHN